jgi:hypothetical protein
MTSDEIYKLIEANGLTLHGDIEHFAALVASAEREACAKVCEENATDLSEGDWDSACINCADHIRARGQA